MARHTPGPWVHNGKGFIDIGDGQRCMKVCPGEEPDAEDLANAEAAAAVPDLMAACGAVCARLRRSTRLADWEYIEMLEAAMAKVHGVERVVTKTEPEAPQHHTRPTHGRKGADDV